MSAESETLTFTITGLTCEGCARLLEGALLELPGVVNADVSYADGRARVTGERDGLPSDAVIVETVEAAGFTGSRHE